MNSTFRKSLGVAAALAMLAGPALAQPYPNDGHGGPPPGEHMGPQHGAPYQPAHPPGPPPGGPQHYAGGPGRPPHSNGWHQGDHYDGHRAVVDNWHHHGLRQPPPGYEWVSYNNQFLLIAATTGLIASVIAAGSH